MELTKGTRLGQYEVVNSIGAGGMGEVFRAKDAALNRDVAIKVLPAALADDEERLGRFKREAQVLASLNHPNIAHVYGFEAAAVADGTTVHFLVMELVEGDDLSQLIAHGHPEAESVSSRPRDSDSAARRGGGAPRGLNTEDAIAIARQIALGLEEAHEHGIIHRDLKPANIKVRADGTVKVLDFGLAKAIEGDGPGSHQQGAGSRSRGLDQAPTMTSPAMTAMGMILGTAAYMAPEQARGRAVDRRADIWAFGVVLYEMLTGLRAFEGDDISITLASVLKEDVRWDALPADLPASVRRLLRRCLQKDPTRRLSSIGDARLELDEAHDEAPTAALAGPIASPRSIGRLGAALAAAVVGTAALTLWFSGALTPTSGELLRMTVLAPKGQSLFADSANVAISPDGRMLAFITGTTSSDSRLWIRTLDDLAAREVDDSLGAQLPFWSPDSQTVAFFAGDQLMTVAAGGGRPQRLAEAPDGRGGTWSADGVVVYASSNASPLSRVSSNGGAVTPASVLATDQGETGHRFPSFLPDGNHFLFASLPGPSAMFPIYIGALDSPDREFLLTAESSPVYAEPGFLLYTRKGVLVAHPFDASRQVLTGEAIPLSDLPGELNVQYSAGSSTSVTHTGALAYLSATEARSRLAWLDQAGREVGTVDVPVGPYLAVALSRDGARAVLTRLAAPESSLWWADVVRGGLTPLTRGPGWNTDPVWSGDGRSVAYGSSRDGPLDLYLRAVDTDADEILYQSSGLFKHLKTWSRDSEVLVFADLSPETGNDLWTIRPNGDRKPQLYLRTAGDDVFGTISPDGKWMAYISDQAGRYDAYVQAFPGPGPAHRITTGGTIDWGLWWRDDGRQLLVVDASQQLLTVDVSTSPAFSASTPRTVGRIRLPLSSNQTLDATSDLQRLIAIVPEQDDGARTLTVVHHWLNAVR